MVYGLVLYCPVNLCLYVTHTLMSIDMLESISGPENFNAHHLYLFGTKYMESCTEHVHVCACV